MTHFFLGGNRLGAECHRQAGEVRQYWKTDEHNVFFSWDVLTITKIKEKHQLELLSLYPCSVHHNFIKSDCFEEIFVLSDWNGVRLVSYSSLECTVDSRVVVQLCNKSLQWHKDTFSDPISAGKCNLSMPSKTKSQKRNQIVKLSQ